MITPDNAGIPTIGTTVQFLNRAAQSIARRVARYGPARSACLLLAVAAGLPARAQDARATAPVGPVPFALTVTSEPQSQTMNLGAPVVFSTTVTGAASATFQWSFNGAPLSDGNGISGSTTPTLYISGGATSANAGTYTCTATSGTVSATTTPATLTVVTSPTPGRIINISSRALLGVGGITTSSMIAGSLIAGFAASGETSNTVILRAVGPTLSAFGVTNPVPATVLELFDTATPANEIAGDVSWQTPTATPVASPWYETVTPADATEADFAAVGAFALSPGSADSAIKVALPAGTYSALVNAGTFGGTGVALAEVYEADLANPSAQLINISSRAFVGSGGSILIAGFVISGSTSKTVLIRASGPALAAFGVPEILPDPMLQLFDGSQSLIGSNFGWGGNAQIASAASSSGAFSWTNPASNDSAILVTLPPGSYTAQVSGNSGDTGDALVEVYAVP
jgi:hypothetical protein